jgi:transcriptional antiterminator NusG
MPKIPEPKEQWYVVHVLSGQEKRIRERILKQVETEELGDKVFEVLLPTETVSEVKKGKKTETEKKFFPGYILLNMHLLSPDNDLDADAWYFILNTEGVIGFAGTKNRPIPMREREVNELKAQIAAREETVRPKITFEVGDSVKVSDGPFESQNGIVEEIDPEKGKLLVSVSIFGRSTPVELEYWQVEKG